MSDEEVARKQQERFQQFLKCLDGLTKSVARLSDSVQRQTEVTAALYDAITKDKDGLIAALDDTIAVNSDLRAEINELRKDMPKFLRTLATGGLPRRV
jgi:ABC-type transporter Mla subunit MlaD